MKRCLAFLSAILMLLFCVSCAKKQNKGRTTTTAQTQTADANGQNGTTPSKDSGTTATPATGSDGAQTSLTTENGGGVSTGRQTTTTGKAAVTTTGKEGGNTAASTTKMVTTTKKTTATGTQTLTPLDPAKYYGRVCLSKMKDGAALVRAYDRIVAGVAAVSATIDLSDASFTYTPEQIQTAYVYYRSDYGEHYWLGTSCRYTAKSLSPQYTMTAATVRQSKTAFDKAVSECLAGLAGKSQFDRELLLHDRLVSRITYGFGDFQQTAYGALVNGKCVCDGYSKAFQYLMHRAGMECLIVTGYAQNENHSWNLAQIDGQFYHVDVTFDDPQGAAAGFNAHIYFNLTDAAIKTDHTILPGDGFVLPACSATAANYYTKNQLRITKLDLNDLVTRLKNGNGTAVVYLDNGLTLTDLRAFLSKNVNELCQKTGKKGYSIQSYRQEVRIRLT